MVAFVWFVGSDITTAWLTIKTGLPTCMCLYIHSCVHGFLLLAH